MSTLRWAVPLAALAASLAITGPASAAPYEESIALGKASFRLGNDRQSPEHYDRAHEAFLAAADRNPGSSLPHYYLALTDWQRVRHLRDREAPAERRARLAEEGLSHCGRALTIDPDNADALAIQAGLQCYLAEVLPGRRGELTTRAEENLRRARTLSPSNPRVWLVSGIFALEKPVGEGGGPRGALPSLQRALALYERLPLSLEQLSGGQPRVGRGLPEDPAAPPLLSGNAAEGRRAAPSPASLDPDWGHDEAWLLAGRANLHIREYEAARRCFHRALQVNPGNRRIRETLLPEAERALEEDAGVSS